ncbi:hypothetical protein [Salinisphaera sp. G21_0]|uniref:hypothetical protein n=1 Tax=Salinisphaera sp. G21_0 TaxID=2821094 RepID=UPI001ADB81F2|nr:hypothetical protein [Salinisphaera sp. G21_0]MBO9484747.1 hypothetical protein [Salinisphaera sp. G21_0]
MNKLMIKKLIMIVLMINSYFVYANGVVLNEEELHDFRVSLAKETLRKGKDNSEIFGQEYYDGACKAVITDTNYKRWQNILSCYEDSPSEFDGLISKLKYNNTIFSEITKYSIMLGLHDKVNRDAKY